MSHTRRFRRHRTVDRRVSEDELIALWAVLTLLAVAAYVLIPALIIR